ncbi:hypothetical protein [Flexivirga sp.]|uniref:hypothetical protein n=1 Tax=Flexivirga sp. TaxID=1962927 RepID=UPI003F814803
MNDGWRWTYEDAHGSAVRGVELVTTGFPTQSDAESWLGEQWRALFSVGVSAVTLHHGETRVYGPMLLTAGG